MREAVLTHLCLGKTQREKEGRKKGYVARFSESQVLAKLGGRRIGFVPSNRRVRLSSGWCCVGVSGSEVCWSYSSGLARIGLC